MEKLKSYEKGLSVRWIETGLYREKISPEAQANVVYFDQQAHACASVHMFENNKKCLKITKKVMFLCEPYVSLLCVQ